MTAYPVKLNPVRWKWLKISPTVANVYQGSLGVVVYCATCEQGRVFGNVGLPNYFKNHWHLTLLELEPLCKCCLCGARNARVYSYWGEGKPGPLGLEGPPPEALATARKTHRMRF